MQQELIINVLGTHKLNVLSVIASCINDNHCNILDSRHAIYGEDFSISLIVNGEGSSINRLEVAVSKLCMDHQLLCMMKRTKGHVSQNLEKMILLKFSGQDAAGVIQKVTHLMTKNNVSISALRQKTEQKAQNTTLQCKMVLSAPSDLDLIVFDTKVKDLLNSLGLSGQISHQITKEDNEYIESW
ncbi:glycine cleavage system protein R [Glaciecola sp. 1036]|uniref:glycine cleavage system protein R n=1 Tax=Alteromonadaceae TaxID=72275 RepID=UPI003D088BE1